MYKSKKPYFYGLHIYRGGEHEHAAQKPELWVAE